MPRTARKMATSVLLACSLAATGCSGGSGGRAVPSSSSDDATPSAPAPSAAWSATQQLVIDAYQHFWATLPRASRLGTDNARLSVLVPVTTDPELSRLIAGMHQQHTQHRVLYGVPVARVSAVDVQDGRAQLTDCQDASQSGVETTSGRKLVVGATHNPVTVTLLLRGGLWKVATVAYPKAVKC